MSFLKGLSKLGARRAISDTRRELTYAQLYRASYALASQMQVSFRRAKKWPIESPKVLYMTNRDMLHPMAQFAAWHLNGVCIPIASSSTQSEIEYFVKDSGADIVVTASEFKKRFDSIHNQTGIPVFHASEDDIDRSCMSLLHKHGKDFPEKQDAMIIYTSGTTGSPKGVVHTHGGLEAYMQYMQHSWKWTKDDHIANVLPLHHVHGVMNVMNTALYSGARCTLIPKYDDRGIWDILLDEEDGVDLTLFMAVPAIYNRLIAHYENQNMHERSAEIEQKLKKIRLMVSGSAALPEKSFLKWREITGQTLLERFGMTEIGMALTQPYEPVEDRRPRFVGAPFPGVEAAIMDNDTREVHQDRGREGELLIRSPSMFSRYLNRPEATEASFAEDASGKKWFLTGDYAVQDEEHGQYQILGRLSQDIIKKSGYKISALEIESRLHQHHTIREAAVLGLPDEKYGEEIHAFVVLKSAHAATGSIQAEKELDAYVREHMSSYKIPRVYHFIEALPRNNMGKISKLVLKEQFKF